MEKNIKCYMKKYIRGYMEEIYERKHTEFRSLLPYAKLRRETKKKCFKSKIGFIKGHLRLQVYGKGYCMNN